MEPADLGPEAVRPEEVFQDYLFHLRYERALAINSVRNAISVQKQWEAWLGKNARPRHWMLATPEDLAGFLVSRHPLSDQTTNVTRWHIRSLYRWLVREGLASVPLGLGLPPIGRVRPRRAKLVVSPRQMDQILLQPNLDTVEGIRDRVMMEVLYATGVRSQELLNLQLHHIWPRERHAVVQGKGNKERLVVLNDEAAQWVMYHLNEIHPRLLRRRRSAAIPSRGDQFLFPSTRTPHHLSYAYLQQHLQRYGAQAGLPMLTAHVFRHAFATHLYMGGADLVSIQMLMGHASITTTAHYTRVVSDHLRQLIERHHPRGSQYRPFDRSGR